MCGLDSEFTFLHDRPQGVITAWSAPFIFKVLQIARIKRYQKRRAVSTARC